jgi:hypothetical protein
MSDTNGGFRLALLAASIAGALGAGGSYFVPSRDITRLDTAVDRLRDRMRQLEVDAARPDLRLDPYCGREGRAVERRLEALERRLDALAGPIYPTP